MVLLAAGAAVSATAVPGGAVADEAASASDMPGARTVVFAAFLDGKPIGEHRYSVEPHDGGERLHSVAAFDVKFLGITAYRYRHDDTEAWNGAGCLTELKATTDDGGDKAVVTARAAEGGLSIDAPKGRRTASGCMTTFPAFYWHAGDAAEARRPTARPASLLNPQDGRDAAVRIDDEQTGSMDLHGAAVPARHVRIGREDGPIDLWYTPDGRWVGLDALVKGKRLVYRLK